MPSPCQIKLASRLESEQSTYSTLPAPWEKDFCLQPWCSFLFIGNCSFPYLKLSLGAKEALALPNRNNPHHVV
ncbi:hypothetical protein CH063_14929 [Colletotrichum higginsianum]|uniref:Uncharacterized protein n=1 Tax=Colletotrichum higginsianum (strain IMI 349063) TaxID=759273 RepID=H1W0P1_COLHI|nr:hypothetical protein CH063_14929 [Colletotrichum higginsianum]